MKKWIKVKGRPMVLVEEENAERIIKAYSSRNKKVTKKKQSKESDE